MPSSAGGPARRPVAPPRRRGRALLPTLIILGVLLIGFSIFTGFYTDLLWFRSVGYASVFSRRLGARALLFIGFGLLFAAAVAVNFVVAYRSRPAYQAMVPGQQELDRYRMAIDPYRRLVVGAIVTLLGLIAGSTAAGQWRTYLQWRHGVPFGEKDAQFHKDISFFAFDLPWYRFVLGFAFATVVVSLLAAAITHYLYGGLRLQAFLGERATPAARVHLSVLMGAFVLLKAIGYWLDRYGLAVGEHRINKSDFTGLTYTDVNAVLQGRTILAIISLICAALFFANIVRRTWILPGIGIGLLLLSALLIGGIYPALVQRFQVTPSQSDKEAPYIRRNITATREAYGITTRNVEIFKSYDAKLVPDRTQLEKDAPTLSEIRLLDPQLLSPTFKNLQQIKAYYDFPESLGLDRYTIDGNRQDVVMAVREVSLAGLPTQQRNWINDHTQYTHGFGFVAALGNQVDDGRPSFVSSDIPPLGSVKVDQPRIYFGQESPTYSIVGAPKGSRPRELDYPDDSAPSGQRNTTYEGKGGVSIGSLWHKMLFAMKYQEANILLSSRVNSDSKILYVRDPKNRVEKVAPWLTLDGDVYPAVVDGRIVWIVDGYTTSNGYPYSTRSSLEDVTTTSRTTVNNQLITPVQRVNYIRNSVKATVDAYDGTVTLYQWDKRDPVLKTWMNAFPNTVKPFRDISPDLKAHLRYPEDLFKVQRTLLASYHVDSPQTFYSGSDFWRIPNDPTTQNLEARPQPPYYVTLQMPGQGEPSFSLTSTYVPTGDRNNLAAFVSVNADPGPDYGKFRVLQLPRSLQINGPSQVQNQLESDDVIAEQINILKRGTTVKYGNLLTFPVGGGLLYVEPVYVQAEATTSFPLLRKVLVSFGNNVAFEDTLDEALASLFADQGGNPAEGGGTTTPPPSGGGTGNTALERALQDAQEAIAAADKALAEGDFAAYGEAQKALENAINRAVAAEQAGGSASPSPSPSPSGTTSPSPSGTTSPKSTASPSPSPSG